MAAKPTYEELEQRLKEYKRKAAKRKQVEQALRESEERLSSVIEGSQQGFWDWNVQTGLVQRNRRCAAMLGYTPEKFENTISQWRDLIHLDDRAAVLKSAKDHIQGRSPNHTIEYRMLTKDGSCKWILEQATIVKRDSKGRASRVCGTHTDITEHKRIEAETRQLQSQLANAVEMAHLGPWEYDVAADRFTFNDHFYKVFHTTAGQVGGYTMSSAEFARRFVHPDDLSVVAGEIRKSIEATDSNSSQNLEHRILYADGTVGYVSVRICIVKDGHGKTIRTYGVNQDITERKKAEEALVASEKRSRALYQGSPTPTVTWQKQGNDFVMVDFNDAAKVVTGGKVLELVGRKAKKLYASRREVLGDLSRCYAERQIIRTETVSEIFLPGRLAVFTHAFVPPDLVLMHLEDITDRRRAEEALREREENYRSLYDEAPVGYLELDGHGRITRVNKRELEILGYTAEELLGQPIWRFVVEEGAEKTIKAKLAGVIPPNKGFERTYRRKDGTTVSVLIDDRFVLDKDGRVFANRSTHHDITERKRAEEALRESEERYRDLYDQAPVGYHEMDSQGRITRINRQELLMLGYSAGEMLGRPSWSFVVEREVREAEKIIRAKLAGLMPPSKGLERNYRRKDGTLVSVLIDDHFVTDEHGRVTEIRTTVRDNTERKRAEEEKERLEAQLRQAQKMESVGRLAGGVAHDFNNMLEIIIGNADLAALRVDPTEPVYEHLQEILKASHRSAETVRQLLAFARKQTINPKALDLNDTVSGMLSMLQRLIGEDIHLSWNPRSDLWPVKIDPSQVSQILANLTVNARDAIAGVGKITIETGNLTFDEPYCALHKGFIPGQYIMLAVSDSGTGMPKEVLEHLFEPFFTTKEVGKGTGLGLSTVYGIMKQNDGFINVYSEPGQGTTFKAYFPRLKSGSPENQVQSAPAKFLKGTETVLIVEDEGAILKIGKAMLEQLGYTVLTAKSPGEAVLTTQKQGRAIQLLLTDVVMPEMSGRELADHLKAIYPDLKCLFMSGYTADVIAHHGILEKGIVFIQKPFSTSELASKVREALDNH